MFLLDRVKTPSENEPFDSDISYTARPFGWCRVNNTGFQTQQALFSGKVYSDAKTVIVSGQVSADCLAFCDEYDPKTGEGVIYDAQLVRPHTNSTAFYVVNTKAGLANG